MARKVTTRTPAERRRMILKIQTLAKRMGIVKACKAAGTNPSNYYNWKASLAAEKGLARGSAKPGTGKQAKGLEALTVRIQRGLGSGDNLVVAMGKAADVRRALKALAAFTRG